ncbi:MAG: CvpA family protein [Firmicutes bacterium]|nr:CvpA family protein [Bacillota bacterium]
MSVPIPVETPPAWTWLDAVWIILIGALVLRGFLRGMVHEALEIAVLAVALYGGLRLYRPLGGWILDRVPPLPREAALAIAFGGVVAAVLTAGAVLTGMVGHLARRSPLSWADSLGGALLGAIKGLGVVAALVVLVAGLPPGDLQDELSDSVISREMRALVPPLWEEIRQAFPDLLPALPIFTAPDVHDQLPPRTAI